MRAVTVALLAAFFPLLVLARVLNWLLGRDPLRLREPRDDSLWIVREGPASDRGAYFSEESNAEGRRHGGLGFLAAAPLKWFARCFTPRRPRAGDVYRPAVDREKGIPDEVYTLW